MLGMEMMLKSMGLDPDKMKEAVENFGRVIISLDEKMSRLEAQNAEISRQLSELISDKAVETVALEFMKGIDNEH